MAAHQHGDIATGQWSAPFHWRPFADTRLTPRDTRLTPRAPIQQAGDFGSGGSRRPLAGHALAHRFVAFRLHQPNLKRCFQSPVYP